MAEGEAQARAVVEAVGDLDLGAELDLVAQVFAVALLVVAGAEAGIFIW